MALYMLLTDNYPLEDLRTAFEADDCLLVLAHGVYQLPFLTNFKQIYLRNKDLQQRGLSTDNYNNTYIIDDEEWVSLTLKHKPIVSLK